MARRSQGVQIALLVILILVSIGLGTGIYMIYQQWDENDRKIAVEQKKEIDKIAEIAAVEVEIGMVKKLIGSPENMRWDFVLDIIDKDLQKYTGPQSGLEIADGDKVYSKLVEILFTKIQEQKATLAQRQAELEKLKIVNLSREQANNSALEDIIKATKRDQDALLAKITETNTKRAEINKATVQILSELDTMFKENEETLVAANNKLKGAFDKIGQLEKGQRELTQLAKADTRKSLSRPDGVILSYNPISRAAIISIGSSKNVRNQLTFDIYPANATSNTASPKGSVRVVQTSATQSQCVATEYDSRNPIMQGDKIFTKDWKPGDHNRYALCGILDVNNDKRNDLGNVLTYIQQNGDRYDAYLNGVNTYGKLTYETQYCVVGTRPDESKSPAEAKAYDAFVKEAKSLNIPFITLQDLLARVGAKNFSNLRSGSASAAQSGSGIGAPDSSSNKFRRRPGTSPR